jgi:hypothetical protein
MNLFGNDTPVEDRTYLLGCSFTNQIMTYEDGLFWKFRKDFNIVQLGYPSRSNFQILEDIKKLPNNCIAIIQWSSLTRPDGNPDYDKDWNAELNKLAYSMEDPLKFLINNFINIVSQAEIIIKEKNIKTFQYIGWLQWLNTEIDKETEIKLKSLPITWFSTPAILDIIRGNCWEYNSHVTESHQINYSLHGENRWLWPETSWGGMSEWIRLNVTDVHKRYLGSYDSSGYIDPHPSRYGSEQFYKNVIIPALKLLIKQKHEFK